MNVKDNRKQDERLVSEIKPGTLFKYGNFYFIRTSDSVYRRNETITGFSLCFDSRPEYHFNDWYEPIEAICVSDGRPMSFRYGELVEVFPDAFISVGDKINNMTTKTKEEVIEALIDVEAAYALMEAQDDSISMFADGEWWKEAQDG